MATSIPLIGSDRKYERWRWQVFFVTWLAYLGFYLTRKSFSIAKVELVKPHVMGWSKGELSAIDSAYLVAYAVGQFLCGALGDRFGTRKVILIGMLASVVTAVLMGASSMVILFGVLRLARIAAAGIRRTDAPQLRTLSQHPEGA